MLSLTGLHRSDHLDLPQGVIEFGPYMAAWFKRKDVRPDVTAVVARVIILKHIFVKALATPPSEYLAECKGIWSTDEWDEFLYLAQGKNEEQIEELRKNKLWNMMDDSERHFMQAGPADVSQKDRISALWRTESIACLLWALGYISELLPYDEQASAELSNKLPTDPAELKKAMLRPLDTIQKKRDVAELWHWRSRTRKLQETGFNFQLSAGMTIEELLEKTSIKAATNRDIPTPIGKDFPAFGKAYGALTVEEYSQATSIAIERHLALNWLCGHAPDNRWADTPTET
jgi:hypothetical protein